MNAEGKPEMGDILVLKDRPNGIVIKVEDHWFTADEYTVRYPNAVEEVVTGYLIQAVRPAPRNRQGISLVSVMVALILISIGLLALVRVSAHTIGARHGTSARSTATHIAGTYLEEVKMWDDSLIVNGSGVIVDGEGMPTLGGAYVRSLGINRTALPNVIKATVVVEYPWAFGQRRSIELTTFFREIS